MASAISDSLKKIVDVSEEAESKLKQDLIEISNKEKAVILACIAPYVGKKVSPTRVLTAEMGISEEFAIESVIEQIKEKTDAKKLCLLINSPGGFVSSSYKVARALRSNFRKIKVFVPHIAASGGTLIALTGNKIVMGIMSQLSPIDPSGMGGSAKNVINGFETVTDFFKKIPVEDAPYTYKVLAEKYNAEKLDAAVSSLLLMQEYATEILVGSGYKQDIASEIAGKLARGFLTHGQVINYDTAKKINLKVVSNRCCSREWSIMRQWLGKYLLKSADKHIIRFVISQDLINKKAKINVQKLKAQSKKLRTKTTSKKGGNKGNK